MATPIRFTAEQEAYLDFLMAAWRAEKQLRVGLTGRLRDLSDMPLTLESWIGYFEDQRRDWLTQPRFTALHQAWLDRVFVHLWDNASRFRELEVADPSFTRKLGRGFDAPWLQTGLVVARRQWLVLENYLQIADKPGMPEELIIDAVRKDLPLLSKHIASLDGDSVEANEMTRHLPPEIVFNPPAPRSILFLRKEGETFTEMVHRLEDQLKALKKALKRPAAQRGPQPVPGRAIPWTWEYLVEMRSYVNIADSWSANSDDAVAEDDVRIAIARTIQRLGLKIGEQV